MTPWERLEKEMARKRKSLAALYEVTGASRQAVEHWRVRGIPARHMRACAEFVGRSMDWLELGVEPELDIYDAMQGLAKHLDALGTYDPEAVISLLATLVHSPKSHDAVAGELVALKTKDGSAD